MKILSTPISVLAHFALTGTPHPIRFKLTDKTIKIEQVISTTEEKLAGNRTMIFRCQSEIDGELKPFEIKFELGTCKCFFVEDVKKKVRSQRNAVAFFKLLIKY